MVPRQSRASERRADWKTCATADFATALNAGVIRFFNEQKQALGYLVRVTTDLNLHAAWIVKHYQQRPEVEQDDGQLKRGGWWLAKLSSTRNNGGYSVFQSSVQHAFEGAGVLKTETSAHSKVGWTWLAHSPENRCNHADPGWE